MLERRKSLVRFTTGSKNLDDFLEGGVESQAITELAGEFGSGKSQICHALCVTAAKGTRGQINSIIFVDTENTFRPERIHQIAEARGLDSEEIMKKVFVCKIVNSAILPACAFLVVTLYSQHNNPLCRVAPIENILSESLPPYDKEKYREMVLDAAETVLGFFGFDRTVYGNLKRNNDGGGGGRKWRWYEEIREQRVRDIHTETL